MPLGLRDLLAVIFHEVGQLLALFAAGFLRKNAGVKLDRLLLQGNRISK